MHNPELKPGLSQIKIVGEIISYGIIYVVFMQELYLSHNLITFFNQFELWTNWSIIILTKELKKTWIFRRFLSEVILSVVLS